jgi:hypothetical protein
VDPDRKGTSPQIDSVRPTHLTTPIWRGPTAVPSRMPLDRGIGD